MKIHFQNCKASVTKIRSILLSFEYIWKENKHLNLNLIFIIVKYVSIYIRSFKRSKYFIRFFFLANKHTFSLQLNSQREITPAK